MMPNVVRGDRMTGLVQYLAGPGRSNEHTEPHVVAGDQFVEAWFTGEELDMASAKDIAKHLDAHRRHFGVKVSRGHVWHCSLSLRAEEGELSDTMWRDIAHDFMKGMGFDEQDGTRAPMRWAAIRHGKSAAGNDHIHLAVNLVREDGTKADTWLDWPRAQRVAGELEAKYGLEVLESRHAGKSSRGYHPAEREAQARARAKARYEREAVEGAPTWDALPAADRKARVDVQMARETARLKLGRHLRAASTASTSEAEFVRRLRRQGLLVRPRFAHGTTDVVTGYSVALRPEGDAPKIWYGGGQIGHDLSLPRLRAEGGWLDTPASALEASAEWYSAYRGGKIVHPGQEPVVATAESFARMSGELQAVQDRMRQVPLEDVEQWSRLARQAAGVFAAWSNQVEETPGPLAAAADALARSAQTKRAPVRPAPVSQAVSFAGTALLIMAAANNQSQAAGNLMLLTQLTTLAVGVVNASKAAGEARQAAALVRATRSGLAGVTAELERYSGQVEAQQAAGIESVQPQLPSEQVRSAAFPDPAEAILKKPVRRAPVPKAAPSVSPKRDQGTER